MASRKMIAIEPMRYGTRMLKAGDGLILTGPQARLEEALGRFQSPAAARHQHTVAATRTDETAELRAAYVTKFGKRPFNGWDAATLRAKLAE